MWVQSVKELPILLLIGPWLLVRAARGRRVFPPLPVLGVLLFGAVVTHFVGNTLFQWSLGIVGIALAVPILLGSIIVGGAILARVFLGEIVTAQSAVAIAILLSAIGALALAAIQTHPVSKGTRRVFAPPAAETVAGVPPLDGRRSAEAGTPTASPSRGQHINRESPEELLVSSRPEKNLALDGWSQWIMAVGVCTTLIAGFAFGTLAVVIRYGVSGRSPVSTTMVVIGAVGVVGLGSLSYLRLGWDTLAATAAEDLSVMLAAGVCNALAFLCLTKALQLVSVVHVNTLGSSQSAMAAIAGVWLFGEHVSLAMLAGVLLTICGLTLMHAGRGPAVVAGGRDRAATGKSRGQAEIPETTRAVSDFE
jgi:drug/metabolite transporter (DMT)-like permease